MLYLDTSFFNEFDKDIEDKKIKILTFNDLSLFLERKEEEDYTFLLYLDKDIILSSKYKKSTYSEGPLQYKRVIDIVHRIFNKFLYVDLDIGENDEKVSDYPSFKEFASFINRFYEWRNVMNYSYKNFILFDVNSNKNNNQFYFINNSHKKTTYFLLIDNKEEIKEVKMKEVEIETFEYDLISHCNFILKNELYIKKK